MITAARFRLEVTTPGKVRLRLALPPKASLAVDGKNIDGGEATDLDLAVGGHVILVTLDAGARSGDLRCEVEEVPGSAARVTIVGGK